MSSVDKSISDKKSEDWSNSKWRPMCAWSYITTCICDFVIFPVLWSILQSVSKGQVTLQWQPITLMGAGLYHVAMGAILGITAYGRTQEKLSGANNGGLSTTSNFGSTYTPPPSTGQQYTPTFGTSDSSLSTGNMPYNTPDNNFDADTYSQGSTVTNSKIRRKKVPQSSDNREI